ncbi:MAG: efflux RND transporter periplasmic adaptor subunit [Bacteroidota bacterium]
MTRLPRYFLLIGLLFGYGCGGGNDTSQVEEVIKPVKYASISQEGGLQVRSFNGTTRSGEETNLSFRASGLIVKLSVKVGSRVRKGALLAQLDQRDLSLSYEQAKASVASAKIALETAKSNLERTKQLYQANSASLSDYEQAKNNFASTQSNYQTAKKAMDLQASQFAYARILASTDGVVTAVNAEVNEFAQAGSPIIVLSSAGGGMEVNVGVPQAYITRLENGDTVSVTVGEEQIPGTVTEVGFSSSNSTTYPVIVKLPDGLADIRPGMPAKTSFTFGNPNASNQLFVPVKAVGEDATGNFVFILEKEETETYLTRKRHIEIGALGDHGFLIISGLEEGELVATAGLRSLYDDRRVTLLEN